jgi:hypothetical protein
VSSADKKKLRKKWPIISKNIKQAGSMDHEKNLHMFTHMHVRYQGMESLHTAASNLEAIV